MIESGIDVLDNGLEVVDLEHDQAFLQRKLHTRDVSVQMEGLRRIARAFVENPKTVFQELANAATELCGADSAGISIETEEKTEENYYRWVATSGEYARFLHAILPRTPSACGVCLERGRAQGLRVTQRFFDIMGMEAALVTDGILLPWQVEGERGTIWILAHGRVEAFDSSDLRIMTTLANFAAIALRQQSLQASVLKQANEAAAAAMANDLAHQINNPLQSLTNIVFMATEGLHAGDPRSLAAELSPHLERLSVLVKELLALPVHAD